MGAHGCPARGDPVLRERAGAGAAKQPRGPTIHAEISTSPFAFRPRPAMSKPGFRFSVDRKGSRPGRGRSSFGSAALRASGPPARPRFKRQRGRLMVQARAPWAPPRKKRRVFPIPSRKEWKEEWPWRGSTRLSRVRVFRRIALLQTSISPNIRIPERQFNSARCHGQPFAKPFVANAPRPAL